MEICPGNEVSEDKSRFGRKFILTGAAYGANPVGGKFFEGCSGDYTVIRVSNGRVIHVTTNIADVLLHFSPFRHSVLKAVLNVKPVLGFLSFGGPL